MAMWPAEIAAAEGGQAADAVVPGVIIDKSPDPPRVYIGCPGIAVLPNGHYVASHSWFGPGTTSDRMAVFLSEDRGQTWKHRSDVQGQWWSSLFLHRDSLYLIGVNKRYGDIVIRRSVDEGRTWTEPKDKHSGLLVAGAQFHCAPVPVVIHQGRLWRAFEQQTGRWGTGFRPFVISAPVDADLLDAANWTASNRLAWRNWQPYGGWLEGNVVVTPDKRLVNVLRVHESKHGGKAAVVEISTDGKAITFDPETGFIDFPGGCKKFTIRFDPQSAAYWSLTNWIPARFSGGNAERTRNTLALIRSTDLKSWQVRSVILQHPDTARHGFQYVDWLFDGDDLIAVSRTAFGDAHNCHDANYFTFHRIEDFRTRE
jgi:hypothetical protein